MKKLTSTLIIFLILVLSILTLSSCFSGGKQTENATNQDSTAKADHWFYGILNGRDGLDLEYINIIPVSGDEDVLKHDLIKISYKLSNGTEIPWLPIRSRVRVEYNGNIESKEKPLLKAESITPAAFPKSFNGVEFNIGLISDYFTFKDNAFDNALNIGKPQESGRQNLPVFVVNSYEEFRSDFLGKITNCVYNNDGPIPVDSVYGYMNNYNKEFFKSRSLILVFIKWSTGSADFEITNIIKSNNAIDISVNNLYSGITCDLGEWIFVIEVDKSFLTGVTDYNASVNTSK